MVRVRPIPVKRRAAWGRATPACAQGPGPKARGLSLAGLRGLKIERAVDFGEPIHGRFSVAGVHLLALEFQWSKTLVALRVRQASHRGPRVGALLSRDQIYTSTEAAHLHLWCIAHRRAADLPLHSRCALESTPSAIYCALSQRARAPSTRPGKRPRSHRSPSETLKRRRASTHTQQSKSRPVFRTRQHRQTESSNHVQRHRRIGGN